MKQILPEQALKQHTAVVGKTGSGKTYTAKGIVEQLLTALKQVCIVDPTGAWYGLRSSENGKKAGFPVMIFGGHHGDAALPPLSGHACAELVTTNGVSCIFDTSSMSVGERTRWAIDFFGGLYRLIKKPMHLVIDEAHMFAPQGSIPDPQVGLMLHAVNTLASGGRSRGVRLMAITQRPAKLHKDTLTCCDTLIAMRLIAPQDRKAVEEWIMGMGDPKKGKDVLDSLAQLKRGEGWVWYPEGGVLERTTFPKITTFDSSATPDDGEAAATPKTLAEIDLSGITAAMQQAVETAKANDPAELRKRIKDLERQVAEKPKAEQLVTEEELESLRDGYRFYKDCCKNANVTYGEISRRARALTNQVASQLAEMSKQIDLDLAYFRTERSIDTHTSPRVRTSVFQSHTNGLTHVPQRGAGREPRSNPAGAVNRDRPAGRPEKRTPEERVLDAIAWWNAAGVPQPTRTQVAAKLGYHERTKGFLNAMGTCNTAGLIEYGNGTLTLTADGTARANHVEFAGSNELRDAISASLTPSQATMFAQLIDAGGSMTRVQLAARRQCHERTKGFLNDLGAMRSRGLIAYQSGNVTLAEWLAQRF